MAKFKACGSTFAKCTSNKLDDSNTVGKPVTIGKMIEITIKPNYKEASVYADDGIAEQIKEFDSAELTLNIDEIALDAAVEIFGLKKSELKEYTAVFITEDGSTDSNYGTYGFIYASIKDGTTSYNVCMLHRVKFELPEDKIQTKGENITFSTPTISGKAYVDKDGKWRTRVFGLKTLADAKKVLAELVARTSSAFTTASTGDSGTIPGESNTNAQTE
jgi:phi13 family phage major tail protein|nr:MAG TPA: tail tube protein [Caudoviricetes sp.]